MTEMENNEGSVEGLTEEEFGELLKTLHEDPMTAQMLFSVYFMAVQGCTWTLIDPDLMKTKEVRKVGNNLNTGKDVPVKMFQLKGGYGMIWGYDRKATVKWLTERVEKSSVGAERLTELGLNLEWGRHEKLFKIEVAKAAQIKPRNGDKVGMFNVSDEYSVFIGRETYPAWKIGLTDVAAGKIKPMGMEDEEFQLNRNNVTYLLKNTPVSADGNNLLFEWVFNSP